MKDVAQERWRWIRLRMGVLCGLLALGLGVVVSAGFQLTVVDGARWREVAEEQRQRRLHLQPKRGTIYDRNGSALAVSIEVPTVTLDAVALLAGVQAQSVPVVARDAANRIAAALGLEPAAIEKKILRRKRFAWLKRRVSPEEVEHVRQLVTGEQGERIRGLVVEGEAWRFYPRRQLAGTLLGFVSPDGQGRDGLELSLNGDLEGHVEQLRGLRDRSGHLLFVDGIEDEQALAGHDLHLTLDQGIQYAAERALANAARTFEAKGGSVIVVAPDTGAILAMASWPGYNPTDYGASSPEERRDRGRSDRFEPGSTMKIFTIAAGLAAKGIEPTQQIYCEKGAMPLDNIVIRDTHPSEWLTVSQVLAVSSNICAAKIALAVGGDKLYETLRRFGFGEATGLPLPGESAGTLRPRGRPWVQVETAAAAFGQGIGVTTLQLAMATAAIANGGKLMEPMLVDKVVTARGEVIRQAVPRVRRRAVSERVARTVTEMMVAVTEGEGTGIEAAVPGFEVAGKTATAQKADPKTGLYSLDSYVASFAGFVPARKPVVAIAVMLDEPMVDHAGGSVAAPVFSEVARMVLRYYGVTPKDTKPADLAELARRPDPAHAAYAVWREASGQKPPVQEVLAEGEPGPGQVRVPDMTGWPMRRALVQAAQLGLRPQVHGAGLLARQTPPPGKLVASGAEVVLVFEPAT